MASYRGPKSSHDRCPGAIQVILLHVLRTGRNGKIYKVIFFPPLFNTEDVMQARQYRSDEGSTSPILIVEDECQAPEPR